MNFRRGDTVICVRPGQRDHFPGPLVEVKRGKAYTVEAAVKRVRGQQVFLKGVDFVWWPANHFVRLLRREE